MPLIPAGNVNYGILPGRAFHQPLSQRFNFILAERAQQAIGIWTQLVQISFVIRQGQ
jgi:hypothetical protein